MPHLTQYDPISTLDSHLQPHHVDLAQSNGQLPLSQAVLVKLTNNEEPWGWVFNTACQGGETLHWVFGPHFWMNLHCCVMEYVVLVLRIAASEQKPEQNGWIFLLLSNKKNKV